MRTITDQTREAMTSYVKDGPNRYYWRATVEYGMQRWWPYDTQLAPGGDYGTDHARKGHYSSWVFTGHHVHELPNIKSGQITRNLDQDIAELTLTLLNTQIVPIGGLEEAYTGPEVYDLPGILSWSRGNPTIEENRWGHTADTGWQDLLVPDRIVRTYEGYGIDPTSSAGRDPHMYATGFWLIDTVKLNDDGDLVLKARDLARVLSDAIAMPPDIPWDSYPMEWSKIRSIPVIGRAPTGGDWLYPRPSTGGGANISATSSNQAYVGRGVSDRPTYVSPSGNVLGHRDIDPLRDDGYWLSTGQASQQDMVWWEIDFDNPIDMSALRLRTFGGPFVIYVSVHSSGEWVGRRKIPYTVGEVEDADGNTIDLDDKIHFVHRERFDRDANQDIVLPRKYANVNKIRLTFTRLRNRPGARNYPWRAGLRKFAVYKGSYASLGFTDSGSTLKAVGNYSDYSDVVKWICAWSGFWWPERDSQRKIRYGRNDDPETYSYVGQDPVLVKGRVWGSFELTGTAGVADLTADQFDKQPLLDNIQVVRDIVGFNFFIDECGGVVWRMPNLFQSGNYLTPGHLNNEGRHPTYVSGAHEVLDENDVLLQYSTTLDSSNLRERIGVASTNGKIGTVIKGYKPYATGMRRIAVWTDQHFDSNRECRVAADMIAAQQMFSFRKSSSQIHPNPAIQIDDQVRIYERTTDETFYHYVTGLTMTYDADNPDNNRYEIESHWLGERLSDAWVIRVDQLDNFTQAFLNHLGPVDG